MLTRLGRTLQIIKEQKKPIGPQTGFQPDGSLVKKITHRLKDSDGKLDFFPPSPGDIISVRRVKFRIEKILEVQHLPEGHFFRAFGGIEK